MHPISAMGKFLTCVCHCDDSWKNLTPVHSVPSIYTVNNVEHKIRIVYPVSIECIHLAVALDATVWVSI